MAVVVASYVGDELVMLSVSLIWLLLWSMVLFGCVDVVIRCVVLLLLIVRCV